MTATAELLSLAMAIRSKGGPASAAGSESDLAADRRLAGRIVEGDEQAFEELVAIHYAQVARITGRFFRRPEIREELNQDVFVKAYTSMGTYRAEMPLAHWLSRVAVNACYDRLRHARRRPETPVSQLVDEPAEFFERLHAPRGTADGEFWAREDARLCAEQLVSLLAPPERLVLTLMVLEELSAAEVAELTGWSVTNVKVRAFRARGRLRKLLERRMESSKGR